MNSNQIIRNSIITLSIVIFIGLYLFFLINNWYIIPNNYQIPIILLFGFSILIAIVLVFFFFTEIDSFNEKKVGIKILCEHSIKKILLILMCITIFIPPITFSDVIIIWAKIPLLNYFRALVFLIGALFLPGGSIFNIIFPKSTIHERLNVESFIVKITIYPIISLSFLGISVLILNFFRFTRVSILICLFFSIIILFILEILLKKKRATILEHNAKNIKISKYSIIILIIGGTIIIIGLGVLQSFPYLIAGDRWRPISPAILIENFDTSIYYEKYYTYALYWGCISYALSVLCGIPYINVNVLLVLFLYLIITSNYLLNKAILIKIKCNEKYCVLASLFFIFMFRLTTTTLFSFHTFSYVLLFISLTLFFIVANSDHKEQKQKRFSENIILIALSSFFLLQSLMLYFIPALIGMVTILLFLILSPNFKENLRWIFYFSFFFITFFIIIDLVTYRFYSWVTLRNIENFSGIMVHSQAETFLMRKIITSYYIYSILLIFIPILYILYKNSDRLSLATQKMRTKIQHILENNYKFFYYIIVIFISIWLLTIIIDPIFYEYFFYNLDELNTEKSFLNYYSHTMFNFLGFFGIIGLYFSYFFFKENKRLSLFLLSWAVLIIGLASSAIFLRWIQYPNSLVSEIPEDYLFYMVYWFSRTYYYSIIPFSLITSISLIKFIEEIKTRGGLK